LKPDIVDEFGFCNSFSLAVFRTGADHAPNLSTVGLRR